MTHGIRLAWRHDRQGRGIRNWGNLRLLRGLLLPDEVRTRAEQPEYEHLFAREPHVTAPVSRDWLWPTAAPFGESGTITCAKSVPGGAGWPLFTYFSHHCCCVISCPVPAAEVPAAGWATAAPVR